MHYLQVDLYDDERRDRAKFTSIADKKAGAYSENEMSVFFDVIHSCLQNAYKKRLPIKQVCSVDHISC